MQQMWRAYDATQSLQELRIIQQKRNHSSGLILSSMRIKRLDICLVSYFILQDFVKNNIVLDRMRTNVG